KISRRHCCVAMAYDRVVIRDLGSRNRVRVNGQVVEEACLQSGDELAIGPILYRLEQEIEQREPPAPPVGRPDPSDSAARPRSATSGPVPGAAPPRSPQDDPDSDLIPLDDL